MAQAKGWLARSRSDVETRRNSWLDSIALRRLVEELGGAVPTPYTRHPSELRAWSGRHLDKRGGKERHLATNVPRSFRNYRSAVEAAQVLGLVRTPRLEYGAYDSMVVLGGSVQGNIKRVELATALVREVEVGRVFCLAADRAIDSVEWQGGPKLSRTEWEHLTAVAASGLTNIRRSTPNPPALWSIRSPNKQGGRRPNTADQLGYLCDTLKAEALGRMLVVTSSIYVPYQYFACASLTVALGVELIEFTGTETPLDAADSIVTQRLLQEIHAAIHAATALLID